MLKKRTFTQGIGVVTLGLVNGKRLIGTMSEFAPMAAQFDVTLSRNHAPGEKHERSRIVSATEVSYIAVHRAGPDTVQPQTGVQIFDVATVDGERFAVNALTDAASHEVGFYAWPMSTQSPFLEFFFFAKGLRSVRDRTPLGQLLLRERLIKSEHLEKGLGVQSKHRAARLGDILAEQGVATPEQLERVAARQSDGHIGGKMMRLGELLVSEGIATEEDIERALAEQKNRKGKRLGQVLVELGVVSDHDIAKTLAQKFRIPFIDLDKTDIRTDAVAEVPAVLVERYRLFPYFSDEKNLYIALSDPLALEAIDMLQFSVGKRIHEVIATAGQIESYIEPFLESTEDARMAEEADKADEGDEDAVVQLINRIIIDAFRQGASDIHIEPFGSDDPLRIRFRVDGACSTYKELPSVMRAQVTSRVKIMAGLDIAERRRPQDGKITYQLGNRKIELRVAILPTGEGDEDVVMRILAAGKPLPVAQMGFSKKNLEAVQHVSRQPYGLILAVGPTGSGKTTTLHSLLGSINTEERKIWTAEDPIEISQKGLRQVQVNPRIGFTFANAMRAFLRADPDVIMVGEMRDQETAHIGVEASLTGHLVFSTLHTNNAPETITRLLDMGLDPFSFSDALLGIIAQRLVKRVCANCKTPRPLEPEELKTLRSHFHGVPVPELDPESNPVVYEGKGCNVCNHTGYKGRLAIHEVLVNNEAIIGAILRKATVAEVRKLALESGMRTLAQDGILKCLEGHTDLSQVLAAAGD